MANIKFLLQGLNNTDFHQKALSELFHQKGMNSYLISVAFCRESGVDELRQQLAQSVDNLQVYVGIRNSITSIQGLAALLKMGIKPYVVDMASNIKIFHPKIYLACSKDKASIILGSSNLTFGGLNKNIEASSYIELDRNLRNEEEEFAKLFNTFINLPKQFPDHVFKINTIRDAYELLKQGRLEDERKRNFSTTYAQGVKGKSSDNLKPMPSFENVRTTPKRPKLKIKHIRENKNWLLVWESKPLKRRSLGLDQKSEKSKKTCDMNLGKGRMKNIEFHTYFRGEVFSRLKWEKDITNNKEYLEVAKVDVEIIIKNVSEGVFNLTITHDTRVNTNNRAKSQAVTKIKWNSASSLIAREELLDSVLHLYRRNETDFLIHIQ